MKDVKLNSARIVLPLNRKPNLLKNWTTRERNNQAIKPKSKKDTKHRHALTCNKVFKVLSLILYKLYHSILLCE